MGNLSTSDYSTNLVINQMTRDIFDTLQTQGKLDENQLYLVDDEVIDSFGKKITNVGDPISDSDAATKNYVDRKSTFGKDNIVYSPNSYAFGISCSAGSYGFRIISGDVPGNSWELCSTEGIEVGYPYSIRIIGNYDLIGTVTEVNGNRITVSKMPDDLWDSEYYHNPDGSINKNIISANTTVSVDSDMMTMLFPTHPEIGHLNLGYAGFATGCQTIAANKYAFAEGCETLAAGKYSHAEGLSTTAGYASHTEGRYTVATGIWSHAEGNFCSAFGWATHAEGDSALAKDDNSFVWAGKVQHQEESQFPYVFDSQGNGTFNIWPKNGIDGFYVDGKPIRSLLNSVGKNDNNLSASLAVGLNNSISSINSIAVGYNNKLVNGQSVAAFGSGNQVGTDGYKAHNAIALGKYAFAKHRESIVWNGINDDDISGGYKDNPYTSHGAGTINLNTINGLSGVYVGDTSLATVLKSSLINSNIQVIRPIDDHYLYLTMIISEHPELSDSITLSPIDSRVSSNYFYGFNIANDLTQWIKCPSQGFGREFSNKPVMVDLPKLFRDISYNYNRVEHLYIKYFWYWNDETDSHYSDPCSMVLPSVTEVGANANNVASTREFLTLKSQVIPEVRDAEKSYNYTYVYYDRFSVLTSDVTNGTKIVLNDYNFSKSYKMSFKTANVSNNLSIDFYVDIGNGPEKDSTLAICKNNFIPNCDYTIDIKHDCITVESLNKTDIVSYLRENSNSVTLKVW